ncbi:MAG: hypothetical protein DWQ44_10270 [Bacteroidetes bacterium]|nr:MAG: hypothetical protein DWQ33_10550 [Bacteroidota bacterium]REK06659.1 MAG: hypothetical protein DWQ39_04060 [Bacteroidota bacterium]REK33425.1 MAG: hypothetical protein DWQ44_10270 [Bacteroidota bacterium]REK49824.1 MAG: hypothetical protein DWQ48_06825 [Bacteroidota bacterium]
MRIVILFAFLFSALHVWGQENLTPVSDDVNILFRNEAAGGIKIHSNGFGISFKRGWHKTGYKKRTLDMDFVSLRHPKQYKQPNPNYPDSRPFFFGKLNFAYMLRGGYGMQNVIFSKAERSGVEVRFNYYGGVNLGLTKPVYLEVLVDSRFDSLLKVIDTRRYDPEDPVQQSVENIFGPGPYFRGFDQMKIYPGAYAKVALSFEYSGWQQKVTAIETGVTLDYFPTAIPIMANVNNSNLHLNFYISLLWGGKW